MDDAYTPIEKNFDGWSLDFELSTSEVLYVRVKRHKVLEAIKLGWCPVGTSCEGIQLMFIVRGTEHLVESTEGN